MASSIPEMRGGLRLYKTLL